MIYINHRINTVEQLESVPIENGIELDVRYHNDDLILHHDAFGHHATNHEKFEDLLQHWQHKGTMILNIKTEGIEMQCINLMRKYQISNWFFLDLSMPYFVIYSNKAKNGEIKGFSPKNLAVRYSEFEPIEYAFSFAGKAGWVWVDCFTHLPLDSKIVEKLHACGFKICLVSPELQKHPFEKIAEFKGQISGLQIEAVCTKKPELWK